MMALQRAIFLTARRSFVTSSFRLGWDKLPDPLDHATGMEKRELLAHLRGDDDPFDTKIERRGASSKEQPHIVFSAYHERLIGCLCDEDQTYINWMWLPKGEPKRCECGHWFKLQYKAPI